MMLKNMLKQVPLPHQLRRPIRFLYRLPVYNREDRSQYISTEQQLGHGVIALDDASHIRCPDDVVAAAVFRRMAFERAGFRELNEFLALAQGCRAFVDVGASGGFFSAVFAATCERPSTILSIEMDPPSIDVLEQTRERNTRSGVKWLIESRGLGGQSCTLEIVSSGYGAEVQTEGADERAQYYATANDRQLGTAAVEFVTLEQACAEASVMPDLIKMDIEGYEWEVVTSSLGNV